MPRTDGMTHPASAEGAAVQVESPAPVKGGDPVAPAPQLRRKPVLLAASAAAVVLGALMGVWAWSAMSDTEGVVAMRESVSRGETITRDDLVVVHVGVDPRLDPVPAEGLQSMVGQRASSDLPEGTLLTATATATTVVPGSGESVVGVAVTADQMPGEKLRAGDAIRVIGTAGGRGQGQPAGGEAQEIEPTEVPTEVVSLSPGAQPGTTVVSVLVPEERAAELASMVSTGKVAIVLDSRER